jgi:DNA-binding transcriptional LysR family regulator
MTLQQLTYFLAAAEHGSFSRAARALYLAQPSLSEQVRSLEAELGVALFARAGRGVVLTEAGRAFRPEAERVLAALDAAREAVVDVRELRGGTLSIGMFGTASGFLLSRLVADFRGRHPGVSLRLVGQNSSEVAEDVRRGRLEAALVVLPVDDEGLEVRPARREEVVYVSRDPEHVREPITIEQLAEAPLILYDARYGWSDPTRSQLHERAQRAGVQIEPVIEIEDMEAALELTASGLGDTLAPRAALAHRRRYRSLGAVSFAEPLYDTFAFIARRGAPVSPAARAFLELAEKRLAEFGEGVLYAGVTSETDG